MLKSLIPAAVLSSERQHYWGLLTYTFQELIPVSRCPSRSSCFHGGALSQALL